MQGKTINGFELKSLLGRGGMAEVWYAENEIGKPAAVKILNEDLSHNAQTVDRFRNEAVVMVKLDHPNIRQVYGYGTIDGRPCIVMEYLEGNDLKARMKQGQRFTQEELERWWNQLVSALNYTHAQGIVHRDIKPSNIFIDKKGDVKLLDFGIAKVRESVLMTQTGAMMGTLMYMSPEQVQDSKHIGPESDSYSLAVTFIHLLTGKAPYDSTTSNDYAIRKGIVEQELDLSALPSSWHGFLKPYLVKEPAKRPALRAFEAAPEMPLADEDEGTVVEGAPKASSPEKPKPAPKTPHSGRGIESPLSPMSKDITPSKPKSKKGLWIALGAVAAVAVLLVFLLKIKKEPMPTDLDTQAYEACQTADEYRHYIANYGQRAEHYAEAKDFIDRYVADSLQRVKDSLAQEEAQRQAQQQAEVEQAENEAYGKCTTVAACDKYLKDYPQGRYVAEVEAKKAELKAKVVSGTANGHEWVDLGLPSGTLWATCNIGASKPEGYGNYYAWGETSTKDTYNWNTYKYANGDKNKLTKYCNDSSYGNNGFTDNLTTLQSGDDPAASNWGSGWQTPSKAQWDELLANTTNQWTTRNGVKGCLFTSKKNSQTLFLPAAGYRLGFELINAGSYGYCWSRLLFTGSPGSAWSLGFGSDSCGLNYDYYSYYGLRTYGQSVRPVRFARQN